jgi:hypothetical protein
MRKYWGNSTANLQNTEWDIASAKLAMKGLDGEIEIENVNDTASYAAAAKLSVTRVIDALSEPDTRPQIGFVPRK